MYKTDDPNFLGDFKTYLKENVDGEEVSYDWKFFTKNQYMDDLNTYTRTKLKNTPVVVGFGDYNSPIVFVLDSLNDKKYLDYFREIFPKIGVDFNNIYFTSYHKSDVIYDTLYDEVLKLELKTLAPKLVFFIGDFLVTAEGFECVQINKDNFDRLMVLNNKKDISETDKSELNDRKRTIWNEIKRLLKYNTN